MSLLGLLDHRSEDLRMAMALVDRRIGGQAVEVALALDVPDPDALAARQDHVERLVVVRAEPVLGRNEIVGDHVHP